ncbi:MAG: hypothetical protein GXY83_09580 [Rhodopirellula sp.]|nr:hypothetical protein [Rhodopirellula sp.]
MVKTAEQLHALLETGNAQRCVDFFSDATERERGSLAKVAETWLRKIGKNAFQETSAGRREQDELHPAAGVAALATCSFSTVKSLGWSVFPGEAHFLRVLSDRRPKWLNEYVEALLDGDRPAWSTVRAMMKAGLCGKPKHENYVLGMLHHRAGVGGSVLAPGGRDTTWNVVAHVEAEPDLLEDVWRLFELEGGGEFSLAAHDKYAKRPEHRWDWALVELSKQGKLPRQRLLDASLDALDRGFAQFRAGWFSAFHELLEPTIEERRTRSDRYLGLLASPIPPTVSFALAAVEIIDAREPLPAKDLADGLRPVMAARAKGTVKRALKLLEKVARREARQSPRVARAAAEALVHEASDVQAAAWKLIETWGSADDRELLDVVTRDEELVAASLRQRVRTWLGAARVVEPAGTSAVGDKTEDDRSVEAPFIGVRDVEAYERRAVSLPSEWCRAAGVDRALAALRNGEFDLTACEFDGTELPRLDPSRAIVPIETVEELIDAAAAAIENPDRYDDIERVLDGVSRLCGQRTDDFQRHTGPLLKRANELLSRANVIPFQSESPQGHLLGVALSWLYADRGTFAAATLHNHPAVEYTFGGITRVWYTPSKRVTGDFFGERARRLAERVANGLAGPLLSAPTHQGGWLDPVALVRRVGTLNGAAEAGEFEQVLALLRLAPERRAEALPHLAGMRGEFVAALRYALGDVRVRVGESGWLWGTAARARSPWSDDPRVIERHPGLGPDAGEAAHAAVQVGKDIKTKDPLRIVASPALPKSIDPRMVSVEMWRRPADWPATEATSVAAIRALQSAWPVALEALFSKAAVVLGDNLDWWEARWENRTYLEPLVDPDVPLRPMALLVLAIGLAAKEPGEHGLATDAAIAAIADGRLDGTKLGSVMATLLPTGLIKAARWAKTLGEAARISPLHAEIVRAAIARSLRGQPRSYPKDLHALVELLKELVVGTGGRIDEDTREFLAKITGSGKLAQAAKTILAFDAPAEAARWASLQREVLEQRLLRVERWTEWSATGHRRDAGIGSI